MEGIGNRCIIVLIHSEDCGHCKAMMGDWARLKKKKTEVLYNN